MPLQLLEFTYTADITSTALHHHFSQGSNSSLWPIATTTTTTATSATARATTTTTTTAATKAAAKVWIEGEDDVKEPSWAALSVGGCSGGDVFDVSL